MVRRANYTAGAVNTVVTGNLATQTGGTLTMNNANDVLSVLGSASFGGGDETGKLTLGILQVEGNFTQLGTATSFRGRWESHHPAHQLRAGSDTDHQLRRSGEQPVPEPGCDRGEGPDPADQRQRAGPVHLGARHGTGYPEGDRPGPVLTVGGAIVQGLVMDRVPLVITGTGALPLFSKATFLNQSPTGIALTVSGTGAGGPATFDQLSFTTTLTAGGLHLQANDLDGATANGALTINVTNSTPGVGAGFFQANNGAVVFWPPAAPIAQWIGAPATGTPLPTGAPTPSRVRPTAW